jgi:hypothetical protein
MEGRGFVSQGGWGGRWLWMELWSDGQLGCVNGGLGRGWYISVAKREMRRIGGEEEGVFTSGRALTYCAIGNSPVYRREADVVYDRTS